MNLTESKAGGTRGACLEQSSVQVGKSQEYTTLALVKDFKKVIEKMKFLAQAENSHKQNRESELFGTRTCEENEEVKFQKWAKIRGLGLTKTRLGIAGISSIHMLRNQAHEVFANYQIVANMYEPDIMPEKFLVPSRASESTDKFQGAVANATDDPKLFNYEHIKLKKSPKLPGPSPLVKPSDFSLAAPPLVPAPATLKKKSLQGQKPEQAKKEEEIAPRKSVNMVNIENKVLPEHRAKLLRKKWDRKQDKKRGLGNALNLSTCISSEKFFFGLTPAALPTTGGFSFGAPNNTSSGSANPMTNSKEAFLCSPFRFSAETVALLESSGGLRSSVLGPAQQQPRCSFYNMAEELLFVIRANLYRLTDGDWMMCGPGHVKIWRHIEMKTLRVTMWQEEVLKVCLNHRLTTDVVYRPMDRKSWIFAAYDFSEGKGILERLTLRFKNQNAAQKFINAVRTALNGTSQAIKIKAEKKSEKQRVERIPHSTTTISN